MRLLNVVTRRVPGRDLLADVILPDGAPRPAPVYFHIHGGGWVNGDRREYESLPELVRRLNGAGVAVISLEYRMAGDGADCGKIIGDAMDGIRFFCRNAVYFGIDPARAAVGGISAGGHLALMAAYAMDRFGEDGDRFALPFRAVLDMCGPTELAFDQDVSQRQMSNFFLTCLVGKEKEGREAKLRICSPLTYARAAAVLPPVAAVQGRLDELVHYTQPALLERVYRERGGEFKLIYVENGSHVFSPAGPGTTSISLEQIQNNLADFALERLI